MVLRNPCAMIMRSKLFTRWTINLALKIAADIFRVKSHVDSQDIYEVCTYYNDINT